MNLLENACIDFLQQLLDFQTRLLCTGIEACSAPSAGPAAVSSQASD